MYPLRSGAGAPNAARSLAYGTNGITSDTAQPVGVHNAVVMAGEEYDCTPAREGDVLVVPARSDRRPCTSITAVVLTPLPMRWEST